MIDLEADLHETERAPTFTTLRVSGDFIDQDKERVANFCAHEIRRASRAFIDATYGTNTAVTTAPDRPLNAAELHRAAVAMQLKMMEVFDNPEQQLDEYIEAEENRQERELLEHLRSNPLPDDAAYLAEDEVGGSDPTVVFRAEQSKRVRKRSYKHEMAHHLQRTIVAAKLYDAETVICEDRNGFRIRHDIAKLTEDKV